MLKVASFDREAPFRIVPEVSQPDLAERLFSSASDPTVCSPEAICREMVSFCALQVLNSSSSLFATHLLSTVASVLECAARMALLSDVAAALEVECHSCHLVPAHP